MERLARVCGARFKDRLIVSRRVGMLCEKWTLVADGRWEQVGGSRCGGEGRGTAGEAGAKAEEVNEGQAKILPTITFLTITGRFPLGISKL